MEQYESCVGSEQELARYGLVLLSSHVLLFPRSRLPSVSRGVGAFSSRVRGTENFVFGSKMADKFHDI